MLDLSVRLENQMIRLALCMAVPKRKLVAKPDDEEPLINSNVLGTCHV